MPVRNPFSSLDLFCSTSPISLGILMHCDEEVYVQFKSELERETMALYNTRRPGRPAKLLERARLAGVIQRGAASVAIRTTDGPRPTKCGKGPGTEEEEEGTVQTLLTRIITT
ncbi:jg16387 [Pararge aegeria aegeria]|uniref:Jg16387 protein n=1 Tax=Pararge aegeria aegeria TaxID=348720 RepID=A0A8S4SJ99_9NEOP|nr:jg16387 [Pararge aegeria aegeria]